MRRAVFLDRDGVLNKDCLARAPRNLGEFKILPGVKEAIERLKELNLLCIVTTNQPDVGLGLLAQSELGEMHNLLKQFVAIDDILVCPHRQNEGCDCRKPKPGLLFQARNKWDIDLASSYLIGDRVGDIEAGRAAGCKKYILIFSETTRRDNKIPDKKTFLASDICQAVDIIVHLEGERL